MTPSPQKDVAHPDSSTPSSFIPSTALKMDQHASPETLRVSLRSPNTMIVTAEPQAARKPQYETPGPEPLLPSRSLHPPKEQALASLCESSSSSQRDLKQPDPVAIPHASQHPGPTATTIKNQLPAPKSNTVTSRHQDEKQPSMSQTQSGPSDAGVPVSSVPSSSFVRPPAPGYASLPAFQGRQLRNYLSTITPFIAPFVSPPSDPDAVFSGLQKRDSSFEWVGKALFTSRRFKAGELYLPLWGKVHVMEVGDFNVGFQASQNGFGFILRCFSPNVLVVLEPDSRCLTRLINHSGGSINTSPNIRFRFNDEGRDDFGRVVIEVHGYNPRPLKAGVELFWDYGSWYSKANLAERYQS